MTQPAPKKSDLGVRTASAAVMVTVTGTTLWQGGWVWTVFVGLLALAVLFEWTRLFLAFTSGFAGRLVWSLAGAVYIGLGAFILLVVRSKYGPTPVLMVVLLVIAVDVGAYFAGRTLGGPKIAPKISPSKTWAGLAGGVLGASLLLVTYVARMKCTGTVIAQCGVSLILASLPRAVLIGALTAVVAQSGDFFESWMKRRAGVKDSGKVIPGHGGVFDRVDGLLAVCFAIGVLVIGLAAIAKAIGGTVIWIPT